MSVACCEHEGRHQGWPACQKGKALCMKPTPPGPGQADVAGSAQGHVSETCTKMLLQAKVGALLLHMSPGRGAVMLGLVRRIGDGPPNLLKAMSTNTHHP